MHPSLSAIGPRPRPVAVLLAAATVAAMASWASPALAAPARTASPSPARAAARYIYWTSGPANDMSVGRAAINGTSKNNSFIRAAAVGNAGGITLNGRYLYWGTANGGTATTVARARLNGTGVNRAFITGGHNPCGVAVSKSSLYWAGDLGDYLGRANINGTGVRRGFINVGARVCWVAVNRSYIYWSSYQTGEIGRARLNGTGINPNFISGTNGAFAINSSYIYFAVTGGIGRARLNGTGVRRNFITGALPAGSSMSGLTVDRSHIYWAGYRLTTIGRASLNGTHKNSRFITGTKGTFGIAVTP